MEGYFIVNIKKASHNEEVLLVVIDKIEDLILNSEPGITSYSHS